MTLDIDKYLQKLETIEIPDIPLAVVFGRKKEEIQNKLLFVRAFQNQSAKDMTEYSRKIY